MLSHAYASNSFGYATAGRLLTGFDPTWPSRRWGVEPDRLLPSMTEVGMALDDAEYVEGTVPALLLAERLTGVTVPPGVLDEPMLSAPRCRPRASWAGRCAPGWLTPAGPATRSTTTRPGSG